LGIGDFKKEASNVMKQFLNNDELKNIESLKFLYHDICHCFYKYKTTPLEYFLFEFRYKNGAQRETYISDRLIMKYAADKSGRKIHDTELNNKYILSDQQGIFQPQSYDV